MDGNFYNDHGFLLWLALAGVCLLLLGWTASVQVRTRRLESRLESVFQGVAGDNAARMLADYLATVRTTSQAVARIEQEHNRLMEVFPTVVRHVGLIRFSPFHDTGGDQSFALAVLDTQGDGVVVTGLHSRHDSRLYAKPLHRGSSEYSLTPEEREAIAKAFAHNEEPART